MNIKDKEIVSLKVQLATAVGLTIAGVSLIFCGFWVSPTGMISESVLVAFGETSSFAGALFGIDYRYRFNHLRYRKDKEDPNQPKE